MSYQDLWVLRHGQTVWNAERRFQGQLDSPLTKLGIEQATNQNRLLRGLDLPQGVTAWASPLGRARASAVLAFDGLFDEVREDARLMEVMVGEFQGKTRDEIRGADEALFEGDAWLGWQFEAPVSEGLERFMGRLETWLLEQTGPTIVMAHGIVSRGLRGLVLGLTIDEMAALPGGQGNIHGIVGGEHVTIA